MNIALLGVVTLLLSADTPAASVAFEFQDTADHNGRSMMHYRAIEFREDPIQPLAGDLSATPGAMYGQVPVGSAIESALAVVWLPDTAAGPTLWLDANADARLTADERHVVSGREVEILATITVQIEPQAKKVSRTLLFRRSTLGTGLRYAVRGYAVGSLVLDDEEHSVLLADGNADGCLNTVGRDRVWIDLNRDGRFDGLTEQFPLGKPVVKEGQVYVIRSDPLAEAVRASLRRPGEGKLRLIVACDQEVTRFSAQLVSDLGELVMIHKLDHPIAVPHGRYRVSWLKLQVADSDGQSWHYSFDRRWERYFPVPIDNETTVPLLWELVMKVSLELAEGKAKPSETVRVSPQVVADGTTLYLSSRTLGSKDPLCAAEGLAEILLLSPDGRTVSRGLSGFS